MENMDFIKLAYKYAMKNSKCTRRQVGAILVSQDKKHIFFASNIPFPISSQCEEEGCLRDINKIESGQNSNICRCIHAEVNLIIQCAIHRVSPVNSTVYCTLSPCSNCARILCKAKISRLIYSEEYPSKDYIEIFRKSKVKLTKIKL